MQSNSNVIPVNDRLNYLYNKCLIDLDAILADFDPEGSSEYTEGEFAWVSQMGYNEISNFTNENLRIIEKGIAKLDLGLGNKLNIFKSAQTWSCNEEVEIFEEISERVGVTALVLADYLSIQRTRISIQAKLVYVNAVIESFSREFLGLLDLVLKEYEGSNLEDIKVTMKVIKNYIDSCEDRFSRNNAIEKLLNDMLKKLTLDPKLLSPMRAELGKLNKIRNKIAHGEDDAHSDFNSVDQCFRLKDEIVYQISIIKMYAYFINPDCNFLVQLFSHHDLIWCLPVKYFHWPVVDFKFNHLKLFVGHFC